MVVKDHQELRNIHNLQETDQQGQQYTLLSYSWQKNYSTLMYGYQVYGILENFPTKTISCWSYNAWSADVDFLLI